MVVSTALVDTNILISASTPSRAFHLQAVAAIDEWFRQGKSLCTSGQVLREYLVTATRPLERNGLGLTNVDALSNIATYQRRMRFLDETEAVAQKLRLLVEETKCSGKQLHDANLVATAVTHGVKQLVTENYNDFKRFSTYVEVLTL